MKVTIDQLTDSAAYCTVTDGELRNSFACGLGSPAHDLLRHIIRNAMQEIHRERIAEAMRSFEGKP
jgi:hypothetical protein